MCMLLQRRAAEILSVVLRVRTSLPDSSTKRVYAATVDGQLIYDPLDLSQPKVPFSWVAEGLT
eukprot:3086717-Rhodomonas_salina.1